MNDRRHTFRAKPWIYPGDAGWCFVTVPKPLSARLKSAFGTKTRGFGSLPVNVTVGKTCWKTSIFPEKASGTYVLPLKAAVRKKEGIMEGRVLAVALEILA